MYVCMCVCMRERGTPLTYVAEQHWQEDESVRGAQQHEGQVHAEVEDLEDLRLGHRQDEDASVLSQRDPTEHLRPRHIHTQNTRSDLKMYSYSPAKPGYEKCSQWILLRSG